MTPTATTTRKDLPMLTVEIVVVGCPCGNYPLDKATHRTSFDAWQAAAAHVALNPTKCQPHIFRDTVPAALAP